MPWLNAASSALRRSCSASSSASMRSGGGCVLGGGRGGNCMRDGCRAGVRAARLGATPRTHPSARPPAARRAPWPGRPGISPCCVAAGLPAARQGGKAGAGGCSGTRGAFERRPPAASARAPAAWPARPRAAWQGAGSPSRTLRPLRRHGQPGGRGRAWGKCAGEELDRGPAPPAIPHPPGAAPPQGWAGCYPPSLQAVCGAQWALVARQRAGRGGRGGSRRSADFERVHLFPHYPPALTVLLASPRHSSRPQLSP